MKVVGCLMTSISRCGCRESELGAGNVNSEPCVGRALYSTAVDIMIFCRDVKCPGSNDGVGGGRHFIAEFCSKYVIKVGDARREKVVHVDFMSQVGQRSPEVSDAYLSWVVLYKSKGLKFVRETRGKGLWINNLVKLGWVQAKLNYFQGLIPDVGTSTEQQSVQCLHADPTKGCDTKFMRIDSRHVISNETGWVVDWKGTACVEEGMETKTFDAADVISSRSGSYPNSHRGAGKAVFSWTALISEYIKCGQYGEVIRVYKQMQEQGIEQSTYTLVSALKACKSLEDLETGMVIHSFAIKSGHSSQMFVATMLVDMYSKCGSMTDACRVFETLPHRDVVSFTAMILGYAKKEQGELALQVYAQMRSEGVAPNGRTFVAVLKACSSLAVLEEGMKVGGQFVKERCLEMGRSIHSQLMEDGIVLDVFVGTTLVDMYAKCGSMADALNVFHELPNRDLLSWNAVIIGCANKGEGGVALELYGRMQQEGVAPNERTFVASLKACSRLSTLEEVTEAGGSFVKMVCLEKGRAIHSLVVRSGLESNVFVGNTLIEMYAKCGSMLEARHIFDNLLHRNVVSWSTMILAYAEKEEGRVALQLYSSMQEEGIVPNERTYVGALKACSSLATFEDAKGCDGKSGKAWCLEKGRAIHSQAVKNGFESDVFVGTMLVDMYAKCGSMMDARIVFDDLPHRNVVCWNAMILEYAQKEEGELGLELYAQMQLEGIVPDNRTFVGGLKACSCLAALEEEAQVDGRVLKIGCMKKGSAIHTQVVKHGFESDAFLGTMLVDMYAKCGSMLDAQRVFDKLLHRDVACWTAMISGFADQGESNEAFKLYTQMEEQGLSANSVTFVSILKACGNIAALETGKQIHAQISKDATVALDMIVATALVDMYGKCGSMFDAQRVFDSLPTRDLVMWSALILGYARQGESERVFRLFETMRQEGIQPDGVTFLSVLTVCSHAGLVEEGQKYFDSMSKHYGIAQTIEHYTCMVDLLGRAGRMNEAVAMVESMPFQPNLVTWRTVLGACRKWTNTQVGMHAFEQAIGLDKKNAASYILMSNIYADAHMWEARDKIQAMRKTARAWSMPGQSWWSDSGGVVHIFMAGDTKHSQNEEISKKLKRLSAKMKDEGYVPDLDSVLWDIPDDEKEDALCGHSERLAIACALINTPVGTPIRVVKNLRVCNDCHKVIACISAIEGREIICRDASRFHFYKDGKCSCGDYW